MKIIFLDFDGVLVTPRTYRLQSAGQASPEPRCIAALNRITRATGARIVVTSAWRSGRTIRELARLLKAWGVEGKVFSKTARLVGDNRRWRGSDRQREIILWLLGRNIESYVILDDDPQMGRLARRHVRTAFDTGLTEADANSAIAILNARP
jgi:hypothetical protein